MQKLIVKVINDVGLHARPAAIFVQRSKVYSSSIMVRNVTRDSQFVNAKSILSILTLGVEQGHDIELEIEGEDEEQAAHAFKELVETGFESYL
jgi:phosphocarrier protein HPr